MAMSPAAENMDQTAKENFVDFYRKWSKLSEEFPDRPEVKVTFVDLDGDGTDEALATSYGSFYEVGWDWAAFRKMGEEWGPIRGIDPHTKSVRPGSGVFARPGEIFRIVKNDGSVEFLILGEHFDKLQPEGLGPLNKTRFFLDKESILHQERVPDLERYLAYAGAHRNGLIKSMEALKVEVFPGPK